MCLDSGKISYIHRTTDHRQLCSVGNSQVNHTLFFHTVDFAGKIAGSKPIVWWLVVHIWRSNLQPLCLFMVTLAMMVDALELTSEKQMNNFQSQRFLEGTTMPCRETQLCTFFRAVRLALGNCKFPRGPQQLRSPREEDLDVTWRAVWLLLVPVHCLLSGSMTATRGFVTVFNRLCFAATHKMARVGRVLVAGFFVELACGTSRLEASYSLCSVFEYAFT